MTVNEVMLDERYSWLFLQSLNNKLCKCQK